MTGGWAGRFAAGLLFAGALCAPVAGQAPREVADRCGPCALDVATVLTLGDREGDGAIAQPSAVERDSQGRLWVVHGDGSPAHAVLTVFDAEGAFVARLARRGEGPGEFQAIGAIDALGGDTVAVYDSRQRRRTVLTIDGTVVSTQAFEVGRFRYAEVLPDGRMVVVDHQSAPGRAGLPLQLVDESGRIVRSLGAVAPDGDPANAAAWMKVVTPGGDGGSVYSVGRTDYRIERWDTLGSRSADLIRSPDWFPPYELGRAITPSSPPQPIVLDAHLDGRGRLWTAVAVPRADWTAALTEPSPGVWTMHEAQGYETVIEVIDPASAELLASHRIEGRLGVAFVEDGLLAVYREDAAGLPSAEILSLRLAP